MPETIELALTLPAPEISPEEVQQLQLVLGEGPADEQRRLECDGWMTAKEIAARMPEGTTDREVRAIASEACPAVVSYPGSPGYKLWQACTVDEINHCIEAFERQGREMLRRAVAYRKAYHQRFRGAAPAAPEQLTLAARPRVESPLRPA